MTRRIHRLRLGLLEQGPEPLGCHHKAVVLDRQNCTWSKDCIGLPSVAKLGRRLAVLYDAPGDGSVSHMRREVGLAWLDLPLRLARSKVPLEP